MKLNSTINKNEALQDFIEKYIADRWQEELFVIDERYKKNKEHIDNELISVFDSICKNALKLQNQDKKGDIKYIYISFLRTSIMDNKSFYRIDAYDKNWFLDKEECCTYWNTDFVFNSLFNHIEELEEKKKEYAKKITSMDIERIKLLEALKYNALVTEFIREMIPRLIETEGYIEMGKSLEICILVGEYMDASEIIYGKKSEAG
ncbi:hypothetical protein [Clostridium sp. DJ247]|uniref:hypothetical protein n=1 Tax=Clostridium sp. DJ247 TaxID=2726188 RepID=UPI001624BD28|nr:hypothetical protein [Clostridium sp. DJ247]MBC2580545.1 hypothetical protein [Clostridium sp. DJ247]